MKKKYILFLLFVWFNVQAQTTKKVMFVGNSYIQYNNLPNLISQAAQTTNDVLIYDSNLIGGSSFIDHAFNQITINKINSNQWDYVVLQEQSQKPAFPINYVNYYVYPYATQLTQIITQNYACSVPIFYTTWGRQNGDPQICFNGVCSYEVMDNLLQERYHQMAVTNKGIISPVAQVWRYIRANHPNINLYTSDQSHPSLEGSMAAAYTFYAVIFRKDPTLVTFNGNLSTQTAAIIKHAVKEVVYNQLENYFVDVHDNFANFEFDISSESNIQFFNTAVNATNYVWNFGDGSFSSDQNPTHNYNQAGNYNVTLNLTICGKTYSKTKLVTVSTLSNENFIKERVKVYPNPSSKLLNVSISDLDEVLIFDFLGRSFKPKYSSTSNTTQIEIDNLIQGSYILKIKKETKILQFKFIKR